SLRSGWRQTLFHYPIVRRRGAAPKRFNQITLVADRLFEFGIANADRFFHVSIAIAKTGPGAALPKLTCLLPAIDVHIIAHHFESIQLRLVVAENIVKRLIPPERVGRDHGSSLAMHFFA